MAQGTFNNVADNGCSLTLLRPKYFMSRSAAHLPTKRKRCGCFSNAPANRGGKNQAVRVLLAFLLLLACLASTETVRAESISAAGKPAQLNIRVAGEHSLRITLKPVDFQDDFPVSPALVERKYPAPALSLQEISSPVKKQVGVLTVEVKPNPLTVLVTNAEGKTVQNLVFQDDGRLSFALSDQPVLGLGEGGPLPERNSNWRNQPIQFDRLGRLDTMQPRWQSDAYGSRNPVPFFIGTDGWAVFINAPWGQVDLREKDRGFFLPRKLTEEDTKPQNEKNQGQTRSKGLPPADKVVLGLYDVFVFDARDPAQLMKDIATITGPAVIPPKWSLGFMQSHRTLQDDKQLINIIDTFREKKIPLDAVIYLGTGFCPRGWNKKQPSFDFNPELFSRSPQEVLSDMHDRNVKVVVHIVPWDRDKLPTLQGTIPPKPGETDDSSHILNYWQQHVDLIKSGVDAFWPDEGDWFNLFERVKRHQLYYQGPLSTQPNVRPWSLHRNGYLGIAQWGGWVWSGDTESTWKTLEGQIAVGINHSLSLSPYWGSDIGGFYPTEEYTGELFARWFQFASFTPSFRSHGRTWWTHLPWGWGLSELGPKENRVNPSESELNNPAIEPIARKYAELRYQLMPYTYTLAADARETGMPLMRALWLHYPADPKARGLGNEFLWGRDMLIAPIFKKGAADREIYLPEGDWYDWWTNEKQSGGRTITRQVDLATMPIYVRAGAIIPFDPVRQYTGQPVAEPTTIKIYRGADGEFSLYEDDGTSQEYLAGNSSRTRLTWNDRAKKLTIAPVEGNKGQNATQNRVFRVELLPDGATKQISFTGQPVEVGF